MASSTSKLFIAFMGLGLAYLGFTGDAQACGGGGGSRSYASYRPRAVYHPQQTFSPLPPLPPSQQRFAPSGQFPTAMRRTVARPNNLAMQPGNPALQQRMAGPQNAPLSAPQGAPGSAPTTGDNSAAMSALEALGGWDGSQQVEQASDAGNGQAQAASHVGNWVATLANGVTIQLALQRDGSFRWNALNNGKTSSFQGSYTIEAGSLTLVRSDDNQQLAGTFTSTDAGAFNFKLNGSQDSGLNFSRS